MLIGTFTKRIAIIRKHAMRTKALVRRFLIFSKRILKKPIVFVRAVFNLEAGEKTNLYIPVVKKCVAKKSQVDVPIKLALDMYVLGQGIETGVFRVCEELFGRLANNSNVCPYYLMRDKHEKKIIEYIKNSHLPSRIKLLKNPPSTNVDILLSPFGVAPQSFRDDHKIIKAHIVYDIIAITYPEYFTLEAVSEVEKIINSLDCNTIIFAISEHTKKELLTYRSDLSKNQIVVIPLAADTRFCPTLKNKSKEIVRDRYGIPREVPFVLSLATLEIRKNLEQTVNAFVQYLEAHQDSTAHLVLAGMMGWKLERLYAEIAKTGKWKNRILLVGFVDDEDLPTLYSDALCFVYLSRHEGFGLPPLEAMACGTPVITSNTSSLPEVVGDAGMMFDPDDVDGVAGAIAQFASSPDIRNQFSHKGLKRAKMFSWDRCCEVVVDTLQSALSGKVQ